MRYLWKNIVQHMKQNTFIFVLFLFCQMISVFVLIFSAGVFQNYNQMKQDMDIDSKNMEVQFIEPDEKTILGKIKEAFALLSPEDYTPIRAILIGGMETEKDWTIPTAIVYDEANDMLSYNDFWDDKEQFLAGRFMNREEYRSGQKLAVVSQNLIQTASLQEGIGTTIEAFGEPYEVVGILKDAQAENLIYISYYAAPDKMPVLFILFEYENLPTSKQYNTLKDKFMSVFGESIVFPEFAVMDLEEQRFMNTVILSALIIALLTAINLSILFRYLLDIRRKALAVFRLCGCTAMKVRRMYIGEIMTCSLPIFLLCAVLYQKFILPALSSPFPYISEIYTCRTYGIMFSIYIGVIYLVLNAMVYFYIRKTPIGLLKGGGGI